MPPKGKMKERNIKKPNTIHVEQQQPVSNMRNVPPGMNKAAGIKESKESALKTRFSRLEKEVIRIADEAYKQEELIKKKLDLMENLKKVLEIKEKNERQLKEEDQKYIVEELENAIFNNRKELVKTALTFCNLKREQLEKQIELTEEAMRLSNIEITDEWRDEAKASILRESNRTMEIFTEGALKDYQYARIFDGSQIEEQKVELDAVLRRIELRKDLDKGARNIASGAEQHKRKVALDGYRNESGEDLSKRILEFTGKFSDKQTREGMLHPVTIRDSIEDSLAMIDVWKEEKRRRSERNLTDEEKNSFQIADERMTYYEQHVNTVLGDYGMSLDRLGYSKENINELAKHTRNAERIDAWNKDYESYRRLFDDDKNPDAENGDLTAAEKRLCELERQVGIVNIPELEKEDPIEKPEDDEKFLEPAKSVHKTKDASCKYTVFRLKKDILSDTQDRKQVKRKEDRLYGVCDQILKNLESEVLEKEKLQFGMILPLVKQMVGSYESNDIRSYVQKQQGYRGELIEKLSQIQRTSKNFQERRYASLILGYLRSEQMGELVEEREAKKVRAYDKSYKNFDVQLEDDGKPYIDRLKSVKDEPLFAHDPMLKDIHQGALGDCYFLAALASIVYKNPDTIKEMMKDNGDGTVTVRFYDLVREKKEFADVQRVLYKNTYYVTIDKTIPERTCLDTHTKKDSYSEGALWVKMMEKAYAAVRYKGNYDAKGNKINNFRIRGENESLDYKEIEGGHFQLAMEHLTGEEQFANYKIDEKNEVQAFRGQFAGNAPKLNNFRVDSPSKFYFCNRHNMRNKPMMTTMDEKALNCLINPRYQTSKDLRDQFKKELDGYETIEKMLEKAFLSQVKLLEIQAMDTETYVDAMEKLGTYLENLILQLKGSDGQELSDQVLDSLQDYDWEGNKTIRSKKLKSGGEIRRKAFEDVGYKLLRDCWEIGERNADKLIAMIKGLLDAYTGALKEFNKEEIYTKTEKSVLEQLQKGLNAKKKCSFATKQFDISDGVGTAGEKVSKGICATHVYAVTAIETHTINKKNRIFLRVQNPHGGNIPVYLISENEKDKGRLERYLYPKRTKEEMMMEKATNGTGLLELKDVCSTMNYLSIV